MTFGLFRRVRYEESYFAIFCRCQPEARIMISCFFMSEWMGEQLCFAITDKPIFSVGQKSFYLNYPIRSNMKEWVAVVIEKYVEPCHNSKAIFHTGSHDHIIYTCTWFHYKKTTLTKSKEYRDENCIAFLCVSISLLCVVLFMFIHFKQFQIEFAYLWYEATKRDQKPLHDVFLCNLFSRFIYPGAFSIGLSNIVMENVEDVIKACSKISGVFERNLFSISSIPMEFLIQREFWTWQIE